MTAPHLRHAAHRLIATAGVTSGASTPTDSAALVTLGERLFNDTRLSEPAGIACVSCHAPGSGFASLNGGRLGTALGSTPDKIGLRNPMSAAYQSLVPAFGWRVEDGVLEALGGHFWDGRADTLAQQAQGPFINPLEMANPSAAHVVAKVAQAAYAEDFRLAFGADIFSRPDEAYQRIGTAIEAFERSAALQPFSSKYDAMIAGRATFTAAEQRGLALFRDPAKGNCAACHAMNPASANPADSPFSDFSYYALGVPRNRNLPRNVDPAFFDLGLCGPERAAPALPADAPAGTRSDDVCGKFRMPSLRNVALRSAFMHNGFFTDLRTVVGFYATRTSDPRRWWGPAGVPDDLPAAYQRNLETAKAPFNRPAAAGPALSPAEVDDLVAFLRTLSDGFATR